MREAYTSQIIKGCIILIASVFMVFLLGCHEKNAINPYKESSQSLDTLNNICSNTPTATLYLPALTLKEEALRQGNSLYAAHAYYYLCRYFSVAYENNSAGKELADSVYIYGEKSKEYYQKAKRPDLAIRPGLTIIQWESRFNNTPQTLIKLFDLTDEAIKANDSRITSEVYYTLGSICMSSNSPQEALKAFSLQLEEQRKASPDPENPYLSKRAYIINFVSLANAAGRMQDSDLSMAYCDSVRAYMEGYPDDSFTSHIFSLIDIMTMDALILKNEAEEARILAQKLQHFCDHTKPQNMNLTYFGVKTALAGYYMHTGNYDRSLDAINEALGYFEAQDFEINLIHVKSIKSEILAVSKLNIDEAFRLKNEVLIYTDSLARESATHRINEIQTLHKVNKLQKQTLQYEAHTQRLLLISLSVAIVCFLLIVIFVVISIKNRKIHKKNEKLFEEYRLRLDYREKMHKVHTDRNKKTTEELSLFEKLEEYLTESRLCEDSEIDRETLAVQLGTNREYLIRAIAENTGMTFNAYINNLRLEYAGRLLMDETETTIKNIYLSAGFTNEATFYRLFKQKFGMNPKEFRSIAIEDISKKQAE